MSIFHWTKGHLNRKPSSQIGVLPFWQLLKLCVISGKQLQLVSELESGNFEITIKLIWLPESIQFGWLTVLQTQYSALPLWNLIMQIMADCDSSWKSAVCSHRWLWYVIINYDTLWQIKAVSITFRIFHDISPYFMTYHEMQCRKKMFQSP